MVVVLFDQMTQLPAIVPRVSARAGGTYRTARNSLTGTWEPPAAQIRRNAADKRVQVCFRKTEMATVFPTLLKPDIGKGLGRGRSVQRDEGGRVFIMAGTDDSIEGRVHLSRLFACRERSACKIQGRCNKWLAVSSSDSFIHQYL